MNFFVARPNPVVSPSRFFSAPFAALIYCFCLLTTILPAHAQIKEFGLITGSARPESIVYAPDGAFWFTEYNVFRLGRIDTNGVVTEPLPTIATSNTAPFMIIVGPDNNLWYTEAIVDKIARLSRGTNGSFTNGILTEFRIHAGVATTNLVPSGITVGPDGNFWFLEYGANRIGVMNTNGVLLHEYGAGVIATNSELYNIITGPDGNLWFTDKTYGKIGRVNATTGAVTEFPTLYTNGEPYDIIVGPDAQLWYTQANSNRIGRMNTAGTITADFVLPSTSPNPSFFFSQIPYRMVLGKDGNIWFTEYAGGNVSRITPTGVITEFLCPNFGNSTYPTAITVGPDGSLWFGEYVNNAIGRFQTPTLSIARTTNSQIAVSWQSGATGFILQGNTNLATTNWFNIFSPAPVTVSNSLVVTISPTNKTEFFRLFIP